jgi:hypothetical protein
LFDVIESSFGPVHYAAPILLGLDLREAREIVHGPERDGARAHALWRAAVLEAREEEASEVRTQELRDILPILLALPRLRAAVNRIVRRLPVDVDDLESEAVLAVLESTRVLDPDGPGLGERIMRAAATRAWTFARSTARERSVPDVPALAAERGLTAPWHANGSGTEGWELQISPPDRTDGLAAPLYFTVSRERIAGERLGALAEGIGLRDVVYRARRPSEGRRIGTLSLRPAGSPR